MNLAIYITVFLLLDILGTALWTYIDRRFPSSRMPFIYREVLWQNILVNFVQVTILSAIGWYFWIYR